MHKLTRDELVTVAIEVMASNPDFVWHMDDVFEMPWEEQQKIRQNQNAGIFCPSRNAYQRMLMIEWITKKMGHMPGHRERRKNGMTAMRWRAACFDIVEAIRDEDTDTLMSMVLELRNPK